MQELEKKTGVPNPRLRSRPRLRVDVLQYMEGFRVLSHSREFNQAGIQPLRVTEILAYMGLIGVPRGEESEKFLRLIQALDATHLEWWAKKNKKT